ncbi:tafazzin-like isoform X2 [Lineus longissimus]|uniref:tafazzin-like isoform X2 n=1 Tax=Lineus longissimus TaxID=88925 RepID=UPI002B4DBD6A
MSELDTKWQLPPVRPGRLWNVSSRLVISSVSILSKIWGGYLNSTKTHNVEILHEALERPVDQPLITVCNHMSCLDDPVLWGILRWRHLLLQPMHLRWGLAGHDICFTKECHALFFSLGKTVPIIRGNGVYQRSMNFAVEQLNKGDWVHVYPEGRVNMTNELMRFKWGVGRLIAECKNLPLVIPFWHIGMDDILPNYQYMPKIGKKVTVYVGQPIDFREQLRNLRESKKTAIEIRKQITDRIQEELHSIKPIAEKLHLEFKAGKKS